MWFANSKTETILDAALQSERRDTRQELSFKSPKCERIERLVMAEAVSKVEMSPNQGVLRPLPDSRSWLTGHSVRSNLEDENSIRLLTQPRPIPVSCTAA